MYLDIPNMRTPRTLNHCVVTLPDIMQPVRVSSWALGTQFSTVLYTAKSSKFGEQSSMASGPDLGVAVRKSRYQVDTTVQHSDHPYGLS